ncbi:Radial spoke head protein 3 [Carabus blaptoides fortunei]
MLKSPSLDGVQLPYSNLMFDRRIVRGNTYAMHPMPTCDGESQASRQAEARRRALARRRAQGQKNQAQRLRLQSPPPVAGRRHERVQTEKHLEEIWERPPEMDNTTQTDLFYERPVSPYYVPAKTGMDAETQIYPGDLFDFDMEVIPILEVLVGKTIEQALIEVLEEEELAALREQQRRFLEIRAAELAETQRLEEQERRLRAEKDRRIKEHEEGCKTQQETEERIAAAVLIQGYIADLLPSVLEGLNESGFLYDNMKQDIDENFMPWLMKEVSHEMENMVSSRDVLTDIVKEILENRAEIYRAMNEEHDETLGEANEETDVAETGRDKTDKSDIVEHKSVKDRATMKETNVEEKSEN